ncbi:ABC transporter permease [uncultured Shewanella sp.]|uniref:ABC transporter permease n=1 Tax=uncultured Shewanella sp. TaxID=173975 RepID=UPI00262D9B1E|nr:ABC transporter permease [uncultured Shewanella sp.]
MSLKEVLQLIAKGKHYYLTVIGSLSLMLAMVFSVFSLMSLVYWQPLPYDESDKLYWLEGTMEYQGAQAPMTNHNNLDFVRTNSNSISGLGAYYSWSKYKLTGLLSRPDVPVIMASHELFDILGTRAFMGRLFSTTEAAGNRQPSAILSYEVWQTQFNADPEIIGKKTMLNQRSFTIIGVTQPDLVLPQSTEAAKAIWLPFDMDEQLNPKTFGGYAGDLKAVIRLQEGQDVNTATQELTRLMAQAAEIHTPTIVKRAPVSAKVTSYIKAVQGDSGKLVFMLLGGALLLTLIGIINLSSLQLARAVGRTQQKAIAAAFGASRRQLFLDIVKHNLATVSVATGIALILTFSAFGLISELAAGSIPRLNELSLNLPVLMLVILTAALLVLVFSWAELGSINYDHLQKNLQCSGKGTGKQISTGISHSLIGLQLGLSLFTLVACSQVMHQTLSEAWRPTGINTESLATLTLNLAEIASKEERNNLYRSVISELTALDEIIDISYSSEARLPAELNYSGIKNAKGEVVASARIIQQDLKQLDFYGLSVEGEPFTEADIDSLAPVALINERLASRLPKPITAQKISFEFGSTLYQVKGVVANTYFPGDSQQEIAEVYLPRPYKGTRDAVLLLQLDPNLLPPSLAQVYALISNVHPKLDIITYSQVTDDFHEISSQSRFAAIIASILAACSLVMITAGIFGIVSYLVKMKQYDLGVHLAFGASLKGLLKSQLLQLTQPILASLILSTSIIFFITGYVRTQPELIFSLNWSLSALVIGIILMLASLACFIPLRKVIQANPIKALHND